MPPCRPGAWAALRDCCAALAELVLPGDCVGCGAPGPVVCGPCDAALAAARPARVRPVPEPPGMPPTGALAEYAGALRAALLGYKERGRRAAAAVLGERLADVVTAVSPGTAPVLLVPVPATAAAARRRYGDHMALLAARTARALRRAGRPAAVAAPLRARPRADSATLTARQRLAVAYRSLVVRPGAASAVRAAAVAGAVVVVVDDIVTTGATLAAAAAVLADAGVPVSGAAVLAATRRRTRAPGHA